MAITTVFIIVGGGTAGCVLANRLSERSHFNVLLIESGGDSPFESMLPGLVAYLPKTSVDWNYTEQYDRHRAFYQNSIELPLTQGRVLGGSSSVNLMCYMRGHQHDYNSWAEQLGDQSWNYDNVLPYFKKSEHMDDPEILASNYRRCHGTEDYLHVTRQTDPKTKDYADMFRELGHEIRLDFNGEETLGFGEATFAINKGVCHSTAFSFLRPVKYRRNLHILKHTLVTKIFFDKFKYAWVLALTQDRKLISLMADREVIIAAGAFNSAKVLMLSGIGPKQDFRSLGIKVVSDLRVGWHLKEQPAALIAYKLKRSNNPPTAPNYAKYPFPALIGYISLNKSHTYPDTESICYIIPNDSKAAMSLRTFNLGL